MSYDPRRSWGLTPSSPKPVRQGRACPASLGTEARRWGGRQGRGTDPEARPEGAVAGTQAPTIAHVAASGLGGRTRCC